MNQNDIMSCDDLHVVYGFVNRVRSAGNLPCSTSSSSSARSRIRRKRTCMINLRGTYSCFQCRANAVRNQSVRHAVQQAATMKLTSAHIITAPIKNRRRSSPISINVLFHAPRSSRNVNKRLNSNPTVMDHRPCTYVQHAVGLLTKGTAKAP